MTTLLISLSVIVVCLRSGVSGGYSYPVPDGPSFTLPSTTTITGGGSHGVQDISQISLTSGGSIGGGFASSSGASYSGAGNSFSTVGSLPINSGGYQTVGSSLLTTPLLSNAGSSYLGGSGGSSYLGGSGGSSYLGGSGGSFVGSSFLGGGGGGGGSSFLGTNGGSTLVQKHIYVHVPPAEPEELRPQRIIPVAPAQKHYKIIFIKAPSPPTPTVPAIPIQPQNEEKTLVYVLVKKPDEAPELNIPAPIPTQPSKPEVYFIRYKTQKDTSGIDDTSSALTGTSAGILTTGSSFSSATGSSSAGFSTGSISTSGVSTSYGPPGHVPGPY